jgi:hypothetical protein
MRLPILVPLFGAVLFAQTAPAPVTPPESPGQTAGHRQLKELPQFQLPPVNTPVEPSRNCAIPLKNVLRQGPRRSILITPGTITPGMPAPSTLPEKSMPVAVLPAPPCDDSFTDGTGPAMAPSEDCAIPLKNVLRQNRPVTIASGPPPLPEKSMPEVRLPAPPCDENTKP